MSNKTFYRFFLILLLISALSVFVLSEETILNIPNIINIFNHNEEGSYYKVSIENGLNISYKDEYFVTFLPYFVMEDGTTYRWQDIPSSIKKDLWKKQISDNQYKYGVNFNNVPENIRNNLKYVILHRSDSYGLSLSDISISENSIIIKDKIKISHDDVLSTYNIPVINKTDVVIGGLNDTWTACDNIPCSINHTAANWINNNDGTFNISFDPQITIKEDAVSTDNLLNNVTAETGNFTHINITDAAPYSNLVGYWNFDADLNDTFAVRTYDFSKSNNDGTYSGQLNSSSSCGLIGSGICLDGNSDFITMDSNTYLTQFSVTAWVYQKDYAPADLYYEIIGRMETAPNRHNYWFATGDVNTKNFGCGFYNGTTYNSLGSTNQVPLNTWTFIACTKGATTTTMYFNGNFDISKEYSGTPQNYGTLTIGEGDAGTSANTCFNGSLDEIMLFDTALTADQILAIYNNQSARFETLGTQEIFNDSYMNITAGVNRVNVTTTFQNNFGSNINLSVGYYDTQWNDGVPQTLASGTETIFNITTTATNLTFNYTLIAGNSTDPFYTPILYGNIIFDTWNEVGDSEYPQFSNYWDNNGTLMDSGQAEFNVTIISSNGTVFLEINNTNYTATNVTNDEVYNVTIDFLIESNGTYDYIWHSWGNGSENLYNQSDIKSYTINRSELISPYLGIAPSSFILRSSKLIKSNSIGLSLSSYLIELKKFFRQDYASSIFFQYTSRKLISLRNNLQSYATNLFLGEKYSFLRKGGQNIDINLILNRLFATKKSSSESFLLTESILTKRGGIRNALQEFIISMFTSKKDSFIRLNKQDISAFLSSSRNSFSFKKIFGLSDLSFYTFSNKGALRFASQGSELSFIVGFHKLSFEWITQDMNLISSIKNYFNYFRNLNQESLNYFSLSSIKNIFRGSFNDLSFNIYVTQLKANIRAALQSIDFSFYIGKSLNFIRNAVYEINLNFKVLASKFQLSLASLIQSIQINDFVSKRFFNVREILQKITPYDFINRLANFTRNIFNNILITLIKVRDIIEEVVTPNGGGGGGGSKPYERNIREICEKVYYFIIIHLSEDGKVSYTLEDLNDLSRSLNWYNPEKYISDYNGLCSNYTNLTLPSKYKPVGIDYSNISGWYGKSLKCSPLINDTFLLIDFDLSLNCFWKECGINVGYMECNELDFWRYFFYYEKVDEENYTLKGIKVWWISIIILILILLTILLIKVRLNRIDRVEEEIKYLKSKLKK